MVTVPVYWQVTTKASPGVSGVYLVPAVVGNTLGGLLTGWWIMKSVNTKTPLPCMNSD